MPKDALKKIQNDLLHSKKEVVIPGNNTNSHTHYTNTANAAYRADENLNDRIAKFQDQLESEYVYGISLKFLCDLGLVNQCFKFNTKYILKLETEMQKLFETNFNQNANALPRTVYADIVFTEALYIMYEQFQLDENFKTYLKGTMQSEHMLRIGIKPTPYQKSFELVTSTEYRVVGFTEANKQFSFFTISLVYDKSDQHRSTYDSYNTELASTKIKSITLENASNT